MKVQKIQHLCDLCYLNGGENHAQHLGIQVGIDRNQMVVDLCDGHKIELESLLDPYFQAGRRPEIVLAPTAAKPKGKGGPKPTPTGDFPCKVRGCPRTFTSEQGVSMHLTRVHQIPGVQSAGQEAHDAAIAAASASDVAPPTSGSGSQPKSTSTRAGMTEEQRERERERDRARKARKREELAAKGL